MLIVELEITKVSGESQILSLAFKDSPKEITLREYVNFFIDVKRQPEHVRNILDSSYDQANEDMRQWDELQMADFYVSLGKLLKHFAFVESGNSMEVALLDEILELPISQTGDSLISLFFHIYKQISLYQPKEVQEFTYKKNTFKIPETVVYSFSRKVLGAKISTIEAIEALQIEHVFNQKDDKGNYSIQDNEYHSVLGVMAAICRRVKPDGSLEKMPLETAERRSFMAKRIEFFKEITMDVALDISFFLSNSNPQWKILQALDIYSKAGQKMQNKLSNS